VHLILQSVDELLRSTHGRALFLVGGMASQSDTYGLGCSQFMRVLAQRHRGRFWADPDMFFTDGDLVNLGADFCMMPSMFEPGGIVQQEFFVAGTPVIAFKTGGLKDTIVEFDREKRTGTGFHFESHTTGDFIYACHRAISVYSDQGLYAQLRLNARASVMDLAVVSLGWYREFYRLRRALPQVAPAAITNVSVAIVLPISSAPAGTTPASVVSVKGSFSGWTDVPMAFVSPDRFECSIQAQPGQYQVRRFSLTAAFSKA
jgi:glycogen synthase